MDHRELLSGFIRLRILLHAADEPIYGAWIIEDLPHRGYKLSARTLYPMLHAVEKKDYLTTHEMRDGRTARRYCRATELGREGLA